MSGLAMGKILAGYAGLLGGAALATAGVIEVLGASSMAAVVRGPPLAVMGIALFGAGAAAIEDARGTPTRIYRLVRVARLLNWLPAPLLATLALPYWASWLSLEPLLRPRAERLPSDTWLVGGYLALAGIQLLALRDLPGWSGQEWANLVAHGWGLGAVAWPTLGALPCVLAAASLRPPSGRLGRTVVAVLCAATGAAALGMLVLGGWAQWRVGLGPNGRTLSDPVLLGERIVAMTLPLAHALVAARAAPATPPVHAPPSTPC